MRIYSKFTLSTSYWTLTKNKMKKNPLFISKRGGTIDCFKGDSGWLFRVRSDHLSLYCYDFASAKVQLTRLERLNKGSLGMSLKAIKRHGKELRSLVESAAAPYLEKEVV